jgi:hypothetical protein
VGGGRAAGLENFITHRVLIFNLTNGRSRFSKGLDETGFSDSHLSKVSFFIVIRNSARL